MDKRDIELIRALQKGEIFLTERPFHEAARLLGWTVDEVLERTRRLKETGVIRRISALLAPGSAGSTRGTLAVFDVSDYRAEETGSLMSEHPRVTHCYIRQRFEGFPFNIYATVCAETDEGLARSVEELACVAAPSPYRALRTVLEFKRSSPVYYTLSLDAPAS
ncbi:MAG: AsnC family transcriptional regulator [Deltaproteobacteria bacterium]|nr:AsnC family transcriptional regulator [Deltaproteobacteria bacterium]